MQRITVEFSEMSPKLRAISENKVSGAHKLRAIKLFDALWIEINDGMSSI
jgi:hypothetical protein